MKFTERSEGERKVTFSDEDLARLKAYLESYDPRTGRKFSRDMKLEALLNRMEKAEATLDLSKCQDDDGNHTNKGCSFFVAYEAWRESKGAK